MRKKSCMTAEFHCEHLWCHAFKWCKKQLWHIKHNAVLKEYLSFDIFYYFMPYLFHSNQFWRLIRTQKVKKNSNISKKSVTKYLTGSRKKFLICLQQNNFVFWRTINWSNMFLEDLIVLIFLIYEVSIQIKNFSQH